MDADQPTDEQVKALAHALGLTQQGLASELGVAISTVQRWWQGRTSMDRNAWLVWRAESAARLGLPARWPPPDHAEIIRAAKKAPKRGRK